MAMRPLALALALLAIAALPAAAPASTAETRVTTLQGKGCTMLPGSCVIVIPHYTAAPGETNDVQFTRDGSSLVVRDLGATISTGSGCASQGPNQARCSPPEGPSTGIQTIRVALDDQPDRLHNLAEFVTEVDAGPGDDRLTGGPVRDWFTGGPGSDTLDGAAGADSFFDPSGVEADAVQGGEGLDYFYYVGRKNPVTVDLVNPARPSGEAGENDSLASIEQAHGGSGADVMRAGSDGVVFSGHGGNDQMFGSFGRDVFYGDSGNDRLSGSHGKDRLVGGNGKDRLDGGCNQDKLFGDAGNDRLIGIDGWADRLNGGTGRDFGHRDQLDSLASVERRRFTHIDGCAL